MRRLALLLLLAACTGAPDGVAPVTGFEPARYLGTWYEIARLDHSFERGLTNVTATYTDEGETIGVLNRGWDTGDCAWSAIEGSADFLEGPDTASLAVTFFWPFAGGYHVFDLDEDYTRAVVSGPDRGYLWLLARNPRPGAEAIDAMLAAARAAGFDTEALIMVSHDAPSCPG